MLIILNKEINCCFSVFKVKQIRWSYSSYSLADCQSQTTAINVQPYVGLPLVFEVDLLFFGSCSVSLLLEGVTAMEKLNLTSPPLCHQKMDVCR